jgi:hypothetical protein
MGKVAESPEQLLKWIRDLNPGLHAEHWRILDKQPEPKGQRLVILIIHDSHKDIKGNHVTGCFKDLRNPEEGPQQQEVATMSPLSTESVSEVERGGMSIPSRTEIAEQSRATETITTALTDPGTPMERNWSSTKGEIKKGWKQKLPPVK